MKTSIGFFDTTPEDEAYFKKTLKQFKLVFCGELNERNIAKAASCKVISCFALAKTRLDGKVLPKMPFLKLIATRSTGFDHIDLQECRKRGITVETVPSYGDNTVAEHAFALTLALSRKIIEANERVRKGDFSVEGLTGFDLEGKTIGIIGTGRIGANVARIAHGFGMKILAFDMRKNSELERKYGVKYVPLAAVLKNADVITLHVPLNDKTHHLVNKRNIRLVKKGAILVNTSRGAVVETKALLEGLSKGILSGAALDVLEEEGTLRDEDEVLKAIQGNHQEVLKTMLENHILLKWNNVLITPHIAFNSREALHRIRQTTAENIKAFVKGKKQNAVC
ncbi:MAG: NAD(P)-dependent oxidoreductase [Candidatus Norongarragalinales archaeon]